MAGIVVRSPMEYKTILYSISIYWQLQEITISGKVVKSMVMFCDPPLSTIPIIFHYQSLIVSEILAISPKAQISD